MTQEGVVLTAKYSSSFFISFVTLTSDELPSRDTVNRLRPGVTLSPTRFRNTRHVSIDKRQLQGFNHEYEQGVPRTHVSGAATMGFSPRRMSARRRLLS